MSAPVWARHERPQAIRDTIQQGGDPRALDTHVIKIRSDTFTDAVVNGLDERNRLRMALLPVNAQEFVVRAYRMPKDGSALRNTQGHVASTIKSVTRLYGCGLPQTEERRLLDMANMGQRVSYHPCRFFAAGGCREGDRCDHPHVDSTRYGPGPAGMTFTDADFINDKTRIRGGKGRGKHEDDSDDEHMGHR